MTITQALSLDVARESVVRISAKQFDSNSRYLLITVLESGQEQTIPSASTITLNGRRPDGSSQSFLGEVQDGKAYLKIDDYLLEQYGTVYCSVSIIGSDGSRLSTLSFRMVVERAESTGWVLMYTAPSALSAGTYHINVGSISYQFTLTQALPVGGCIYFASDYTGAKTVVNGADVETLTLTVGTGGTELIGSDVVNFLSQISQEVAEINEGLESKADKSAIEENLAAGTSLATIDKDSYSSNTSPYLHRISPSGKRCEYDVIGGTVGWNQLLTDETEGTTTVAGAVTRTVANHKITFNGTASETVWATINKTFNVITGHKYVLLSSAEIPNLIDKYQLYLSGSIGSIYNINRPNIYSAQGTGESKLRYAIYSGATINASLDDPRIIDLTVDLGSPIADYAYQLEQTTAESGIAWLRSFGFLTKSYYPYSEPTLESVQATERIAEGFNLFDRSKATENVGLAWATGSTFNEQGSIVTDYIRALDATYYTNFRGAVFGYDSDKNYIGAWSNSGWVKSAGLENTSRTIQGAYYIRFSFRKSSNSDTDMTAENISVSLNAEAGSGTYYPYESHTYPLGEITLRGIPKLDSNNNIYYDGDRRKADGTVTRRYGVVDLGSLNYTKQDDNLFRCSIADMKQSNSAGIVITLPYKRRADTYAQWTDDDKVYGTRNDYDRVYFKDTAYATTTEFKTAMSGVYLVYELATPTTESTDSFTPIQYTGSTEEFSTDNDVPVGVDAKYYTDLTLPTLPTANGTYTLKCTVTDGTGIVSWVSE